MNEHVKRLTDFNEIVSKHFEAKDEADRLSQSSPLLHRLLILKCDLASAFRRFLR